MNRQILEFPPFRLDIADESLWRGSTRTPLPAKEFAVLCYLAMHPKRLVTADELFRAVWPGVRVSSGVLKVRIRQIRRTLGDSAKSPQFIECEEGDTGSLPPSPLLRQSKVQCRKFKVRALTTRQSALSTLFL